MAVGSTSCATGQAIQLPFVIENDTNLSALGERYRGAAKQRRPLSDDIGANVSAGIVLDGACTTERNGQQARLVTFACRMSRGDSIVA